MTHVPTHATFESVGLDLDWFKDKTSYRISKDGNKLLATTKLPGATFRANVDLETAFEAVKKKLQGRTGWDFEEIEDASHRIALRVAKDRATRDVAAQAITSGWWSKVKKAAKKAGGYISKGASAAQKVAQHPAFQAGLSAVYPPAGAALRMGLQAQGTIQGALQGDPAAKAAIANAAQMAAQGYPAAQKAYGIFQNVFQAGQNKGTWAPFGGSLGPQGRMPGSPYGFNYPGMPRPPAQPVQPPIGPQYWGGFPARAPMPMPQGFPFGYRGSLGPWYQQAAQYGGAPPPYPPAGGQAFVPSPYQFGGGGAQAAWLSGEEVGLEPPQRGWLLNVPYRSNIEAQAIDTKNPFHILRGLYNRGK